MTHGKSRGSVILETLNSEESSGNDYKDKYDRKRGGHRRNKRQGTENSNSRKNKNAVSGQRVETIKTHRDLVASKDDIVLSGQFNQSSQDDLPYLNPRTSK